MPAEPVRERTMAAIASRLGTIVAGTVVYTTPYGSKSVEFWTTPSLVTRQVKAIQQYDQPLTSGSPTTQLDLGPVLSVVRSSGSTFQRQTHADPAGHESEGYEHQQRVMIWGYVKATATVLAGTLVERLWQDCVECLLVDRTLGSGATAGPALGSGPDDQGSLDTDDGQLEPLGFFAQDWLVVV